MSRGCAVTIIGAGPYALSTASFLRRVGIKARVFGEVMGFWHTMPQDSYLRSFRRATSIADPDRALTLSDYEKSTGREPMSPIPLAEFVEYGHWFQQQAGVEVDSRHVTRLSRTNGLFRLALSDGEGLETERVVVAAGIKPFAWRPAPFERIDSGLVSHSSEHREYAEFRDRRVAVVGGGQSAMEAASFLHRTGAEVELIARRPSLRFLRGEHLYEGKRVLSGVLYPEWGVGPPGVNWLVGRPGLFRLVPTCLADQLAARAIRPAGSAWLRPLLDGVRITLGRRVDTAGIDGAKVRLRLDDGGERIVDRVVLGTGYRVDLERYPFLDPDLLASLRRLGSFPRLSPGFESSIKGLYFIGAPAAASAGPGMRFVSHSGFAAKAVTRSVLEQD